MRHVLRTAGAVVTAGALVAVAGPAYAATAVTQVPVASTGFFGGFTDVTAVSASDGWAVGGNGNGVVQRFNGARWTVTASPDLLDRGANNWAVLSGVDAVPAGAAFAVGSATATSGGAETPVAVRWTGSAWVRMTVPAGPSAGFAAVKAFSASDVWAVGDTSGSNPTSTVAMHFDGTAWTRTPSPSPGTKTTTLTSVDGRAPGDIWAVGYSLNLPYGNRVRQSMILHWNGTAWSRVPNPDNGSTYLYDVAAVSATDAWAVGSDPAGALVTRWDGAAWHRAPAPPLAALRSVSARSSADVWVAGNDAAGAPAVAHWTGAGWSVTPVTVTGGVGSPSLTAVTVADATTTWAVGGQWDGSTGQSSSIGFRVAG